MGALADIFADVRLNLQTGEFEAKAAKSADTVGKSMGQRLSASIKKSWSGANIGQGLIQGLGLAGGLGAFSLISGAISKVGDVLSDANAAFIAEQKSVQKLGTALKANVRDWDGNTEAIERTLKARMDLGFSDDEQRESLALLVAATKDVNKALEIQRTAMDLARLKGISLADASSALIKVEAGQYRALKSLGIVLKEGATQTEALAAVQAVAAGQAEDYAKTIEGKLLVSSVKMDEALERIGQVTAPIMAEAMVALAGVVEGLATGFDHATDSATGLEERLLSLAGLWPGLGVAIGNADAAGKAGALFKVIEEGAPAARKDLERLKDADLKPVVRAMGDVGDASDGMAKQVKKDAHIVETSWEEMKQKVVDDAEAMIADAFGPIIAQDRLAATLQAEISAQKRIIASKTSSDAEKRDARARLHELGQDNAEYLLDLAKAGQTGSKAYSKGIAELKDEIKKAKGPAKAALQEVLDKIREVEREGKVVPIHVIVDKKGNIGYGGARASGGPVQAGHLYLVNEDTPRSEYFMPSGSGTIIPHDQVTAGGATYNITVNPGNDVSTLAARRFGQSVLDVVADGLREQRARSA